MDRYILSTPFAGSEDLPLPLDVVAVPPPPGFCIPKVSPPPALRRLFTSTHSVSDQESSKSNKVTREDRVKDFQKIRNTYRTPSPPSLPSIVEEQIDTAMVDYVQPQPRLERPPPTLLRESYSPVVSDIKLKLSSSSKTASSRKYVSSIGESGLDNKGARRDIYDFLDPDLMEEEERPTATLPSNQVGFKHMTNGIDEKNTQINDDEDTITVSTTPGLHTVASIRKRLRPRLNIVPQKRQAEDDDRGWVETIVGRKKVGVVKRGKRIERLLERGKDGRLVWFYCKYTGEANEAGDAIYQTALKKLPYVVEMIKTWERDEKRK